jgi:hypothetical protein
MKARRSSRALAFVMASFLDKLLKDTTTLGSLIHCMSGGGTRYDSVLSRSAGVMMVPPTMTRLLEACVLKVLLLMLTESCIVKGRSRSKVSSDRQYLLHSSL